MAQRTPLEQWRLTIEHSWILKAVVVLLTVALAYVVRLVLSNFAGTTTTLFNTFLLGTILMALWLGTRPAVAAALLGGLLSAYLLSQFHGINILSSISFALDQVLYLIICAVIIIASEEQRRARVRAEHRRLAIEGAAAQLQQATNEHERLIRRLDNEAAYLEAVLRQIPAAVVIADPSGKIISTNRAAEQMSTMNMQTMESVADYTEVVSYHADGQPYRPEELPLARAVTRGEVIEGEEMVIENQRGRRTIRANAAPVRNAKGEIIAAITVAIDVTEERVLRDQLQQALTQADLEHRRMQAVMEAIPAGVWVTDANRELIYSNQNLYRIWGLTPQPEAGESKFDKYKAWLPDSGEPLAPHEWAHTRALATGEVIVGKELEIERFDNGTRRVIVDSAAPICAGDGSVIGAVTAILDVTEMRQAQRAARESEAIYRALWEQGYGAKLITDKGIIVDCNDAYAELLGYQRSELVGMDGVKLLVTDGQPEAVERVRDDVVGLTTTRMIRKDGTIIPVEVRAQMIDYKGRRVRLTTIRRIADS
jgi:PAS domain S-box-containing protein